MANVDGSATLQRDREHGAHFAVSPSDPRSIFVPEDFSAEQVMFARTAREFVEREVRPVAERLEHQDWELTVALLRKAGDMGLLAADIPETYGGLDLDKVSSTLIGEHLSGAGSFALSHGANVGIGTLPIVLFGTEEQRARYLPRLATGEWFAAYALTEPDSGSDALGARATARLSPDGSHYVLNGRKQFITNSAFADVFIVYAKIDGQQFSAFIVERTFPGVATGPEEKKMGIKASSTRALILDDVRVPKENLLGQAGRGHVIAFNILNIGRYKLAAGCVGAAKEALELTARYANTRRQFGRPIASFPLIQAKIGRMAAYLYASESAVYRTAGAMDAALSEVGDEAGDRGPQIAARIAEFAVECSVNKVFGSEMLDFVVDEGVQIHGGAGYIQEFAIERMYRDSRINRIFEGTNEINRLLIPGTLLKWAEQGKLALYNAARAVQAEILEPIRAAAQGGPLERETQMVTVIRKLFLLAGGMAVQTFGQRIEDEQEVLAALADMVIALYTAESALVRAGQCAARQLPAAEAHRDLAALYIAHAFPAVEEAARQVFAACTEGDELAAACAAARKLARGVPGNSVTLGRRVASRVLTTERYLS